MNRLDEIKERWSRTNLPEQLFSAHVKQDIDYLLSLVDGGVAAKARELEPFCEHKEECKSNERYPSPPCDCGLVAALTTPTVGGERRCECGHRYEQHGGIGKRYCHVCPAGECAGYLATPTPTAAAPVEAVPDEDDLPVCLVCRHFQGCDCEHECAYTALPMDREQLLSNWPLPDVLRQLATWAEHLHSDHDCDCHGWEARSFLVPAAGIYAEQPSASASSTVVEVAKEIANLPTRNAYGNDESHVSAIAAIISRHLSPTEAAQPEGEQG